MNTKDSRIYVRTNGDFKRRIQKAAELSSDELRKVTISDLILEAVDEKLTRLSKKHPELARAV